MLGGRTDLRPGLSGAASFDVLSCAKRSLLCVALVDLLVDDRISWHRVLTVKHGTDLGHGALDIRVHQLLNHVDRLGQSRPHGF